MKNNENRLELKKEYIARFSRIKHWVVGEPDIFVSVKDERNPSIEHEVKLIRSTNSRIKRKSDSLMEKLIREEKEIGPIKIYLLGKNPDHYFGFGITESHCSISPKESFSVIQGKKISYGVLLRNKQDKGFLNRPVLANLGNLEEHVTKFGFIESKRPNKVHSDLTEEERIIMMCFLGGHLGNGVYPGDKMLMRHKGDSYKGNVGFFEPVINFEKADNAWSSGMKPKQLVTRVSAERDGYTIHDLPILYSEQDGIGGKVVGVGYVIDRRFSINGDFLTKVRVVVSHEKVGKFIDAAKVTDINEEGIFAKEYSV